MVERRLTSMPVRWTVVDVSSVSLERFHHCVFFIEKWSTEVRIHIFDLAMPLAQIANCANSCGGCVYRVQIF